MESFDLIFATKTKKRYACSVCWGDLEVKPDPTDRIKYFVLCVKCGDETRGYVSQYFVNKRRGESNGEKVNVTRWMMKAGIIENPLDGKSNQEILEELGF